MHVTILCLASQICFTSYSLWSIVVRERRNFLKIRNNIKSVISNRLSHSTRKLWRHCRTCLLRQARDNLWGEEVHNLSIAATIVFLTNQVTSRLKKTTITLSSIRHLPRLTSSPLMTSKDLKLSGATKRVGSWPRFSLKLTFPLKMAVGEINRH